MTTAPDPFRPVRRMLARDRGESHRVATPLELFFDLCFVVAVAQAGRELAHALAAGHLAHALTGFTMSFFAIWWAWMNFTWFASAYDVDDVPYRLTTLVQITGVLVLAAGVPRVFEDRDLALAVAGYVLMRLAMVTQWLRAARGESGPARTCALRYAAGVTVVQAFWVVLLFLPHGAQGPLFPVGVLAELAVPVWAEKDEQTPWHRHHIVERYGLFTIIVLGETVAAATVAIQTALDEHLAVAELLPIAAGGLLICFGAWWIYFADDGHGHLRGNRQALPWGYGHYAVFASAAAIGAGLEVAVEHAVGAAHVSARAASAAVTVPTALFLFTVWLLHARHHKRGAAQAVLPLAALSVLAATLAGESGVLIAGLLVALAVAAGLTLSAKRS
ncbi:low temperature requirement protein A [Kitasatospora sp. NPDC001540]|uniref:low temperature requirement protein A n=1 Tax=Kitasatospora sp. NPDC001540 TaxID=3364014 RepID=UPI00367D9513